MMINLGKRLPTFMHRWCILESLYLLLFCLFTPRHGQAQRTADTTDEFPLRFELYFVLLQSDAVASRTVFRDYDITT